MRNKVVLNKFSSVDESNRMLHKFFFFTDGPFKSKSAVFFRHEDGKRLAFFTFASSYEEAVLFAKAAYPYPKIGHIEFEVHRVCKKRKCRCGIHPFLFIFNWATHR